MLLRLDSTQGLNWKRDERGYTAFVTLGVANQPLVYHEVSPDGIRERIETITEDELFDEASIHSAMALPIVLGHPQKGVFDQNSEGLQVGTLLQEYRNEGGSLDILAQVHDRRGIEVIDQAIASGRSAEVSPGYRISHLTHEGGLYHQHGRKYDHLALLDGSQRGRGRETVSFRLDTEDADIAYSPTLTEKPMFKINIDGQEFETEDQKLVDAVAGLVARLDSATSEVASISGELEGTKSRLDAAIAQRLDSDALGREIEQRLGTWAMVEPILSQKDGFRRDNSLSVDEIRVEYIKHVAPDALKRMDSSDNNYSVFVSGLWEALKPAKTAAKEPSGASEDLQEIDNYRTDSIDPGAKARAEAIAAIENAYKG